MNEIFVFHMSRYHNDENAILSSVWTSWIILITGRIYTWRCLLYYRCKLVFCHRFHKTNVVAYQQHTKASPFTPPPPTYIYIYIYILVLFYRPFHFDTKIIMTSHGVSVHVTIPLVHLFFLNPCTVCDQLIWIKDCAYIIFQYFS